MRIVFFVFLFLASIHSRACSCGSIGEITIEQIENVGEAFVGTIKSIVHIDSNSSISATFVVHKYLKGRMFSSEITVFTGRNGSSCGLNFVKGQKWYIFAQYSDSQLYSSQCSRSVQLTKITATTMRLIIGRKHHRKAKFRYRRDKKTIKKYLKETTVHLDK